MTLYKKCKIVFLQCTQQFQSDANLRTLFDFGDLIAYKYGLPESSSIEERVNNIISHLLTQTSTNNNRPVLSIFIEALQERYHPEQQIYVDLEELRKDVEQESIKFFDVPVVILAMTQPEAEEVVSGQILTHKNIAPESGEQLRTIQRVCSSHQTDWYQHYQAKRDDWIPFSRDHLAGDHRSARQIVSYIANQANVKRQKEGKTTFVHPCFLSESFFADDRNTHLATWNKIRESGGIFLIDSVSLFYPTLRKLLDASRLISSIPGVSILVFYPGDPGQIEINQVVEQDIKSYMEVEFMRFAEQFEKTCEIGATNIHSLQRWLYSSILDIADAIHTKKPNSAKLDLVRSLGESKGLAEFVVGPGEGK